MVRTTTARHLSISLILIVMLYSVLYVALHMAAMVGNASMTDLLIRRGAVVNGTDYHGSTPLHISYTYCNVVFCFVCSSAHGCYGGQCQYDRPADQEGGGGEWYGLPRLHTSPYLLNLL